ncbi:hypothetical protein [Aquimarina sp. AU474]|uniref:hypothetical protein n=1 Tax=Aquimarina sp. AU474 TaxID=2108529 RepID=UPI0013587630|nr:hypothetical protein [Aquimarina sp. AU474]
MNNYDHRQANRVLEHYENYLMRSIYVKYLAVVKSVTYPDRYTIEIGVTGVGKVELDENIDVQRAYEGRFPENKIPKLLPIPPKNKNKIIPRDTKIITVDEIKTLDVEDKNIFEKGIFTEIINPNINYKDWFSFPYGAQPIYSKNQKDKGTLGAVFRLKDFPDELFGISNWHVISGKTSNLGDKVYDSDSNKIGSLFWHSFDIYREVAFVKFDPKIAEKMIKTYNLSCKPELMITRPKLNMNVQQLGQATSLNNNRTPKRSTIHSLNATIRISDSDDYDNGRKIFKKQLLIKHFSRPGDSGALVHTIKGKKTKAIGSIFALTPKLLNVFDSNDQVIQYTVANNIFYIFNKLFDQKQEVYIGIEDGIIKTKLVNQFKINNN